jgi:ATP-dependent Clp protease ATP-binding subunit ClpC
VYGARPLKRAIQEKIEDFISDEVLRDNINTNDTYMVSINEETVSIEKTETKPEKKKRKRKGE